MSFIHGDLFWLDGYETLGLCLRKDGFIVAYFLCQTLEGRQDILFKTELQNN